MGFVDDLLKKIKKTKKTKGKQNQPATEDNDGAAQPPPPPQSPRKQQATTSTATSSISGQSSASSSSSSGSDKAPASKKVNRTTVVVTPKVTSPVPVPQVRPKSPRTKRTSASMLDISKELSSPHLVPSSPVPNVYDRVFDCVVLVIHCSAHNRIAVAQSPTDALWLPYVHMTGKLSWYEAAREAIPLVLACGRSSKHEWLRRNPPYDQIQLLEINRIQIPTTRKFVNRHSFYVRLKPPSPKDQQPQSPQAEHVGQKENSDSTSKKSGKARLGKQQFTCCVDMPRLKWFDIAFIGEGCVENCWGPELVEFSRQVAQCHTAAIEAITGQIPEGQPAASSLALPPIAIRQNYREFGVDELFAILPRKDSPQSNDSCVESLKETRVNDTDLERLYTDFLDHCYPSFFMTFDSFKHYLFKNGFEFNEQKVKRLFRAFNTNQNGYLTFAELLIGLVCMERETPHVEFRIKFVFNYYDSKRRGFLTEDNFLKIVRDLNSDRDGKLVTCSEKDLAHKARQAMASFKTKVVQERQVVSYSAFVIGIGGHTFRGTSHLCRSRRNIFQTISRRITARTIKLNVTKGKLGDVIIKKNYKGSCKPCKSLNYKVVDHLTVLTPDGYFAGTQPLEMSLECTAMVPQLNKSNLDKGSGTSVETTSSGSSMYSKEDHFITDPSVLPHSAAMTLLAKIRQYNATKPRQPMPGQRMSGLMNGPGERDQLIELLKTIYDQVIPILKAEARCKPVPSPCFVIGDIHGNLEDLISLERTIWRRFPEVNGMHYLFLGDYVDRGRWGLECALYLISMKVLKPNNITLLRGNHEVRDIQIKYSYRRECLAKYGETHGHQIWQLTNRIFDHMPLCAVINDSIFCAHGGLPHAVHTVAEINQAIQVDLPNPEGDCLTAWEIMWSDPMVPEQFANAVTMFDQQSMATLRPGYVFNTKRGTAYYFTDVGADQFLADNQLTHIIRAHEVPRIGFTFHFDTKCTTIFSCSHYCGNDNDCAVILVDGAWMRVIRIDTSANVSATEGI